MALSGPNMSAGFESLGSVWPDAGLPGKDQIDPIGAGSCNCKVKTLITRTKGIRGKVCFDNSPHPPLGVFFGIFVIVWVGGNLVVGCWFGTQRCLNVAVLAFLSLEDRTASLG